MIDSAPQRGVVGRNATAAPFATEISASDGEKGAREEEECECQCSKGSSS